jgi:PhnB protein
MTKAKSYVREGLRSVTATLVVKNALEAIEFYKKAFGAELMEHSPGFTPGSTMHAAVRIGDAVVFLGDEMPQSPVKAPGSLGGASGTLMLFVPNCDEVFKRAILYGAKALMPVADQFWGDRFGQVVDPFGHVWGIATHKEELSPAEMTERTNAWMAQMKAQR